MRLDGLDAAPDVEGSVATYTDVEDAAEVTYEVTGTGVKENIVLDQAPDAGAAPLSYVYTIQLSTGLTPRLLSDGSVQVRNTDGSTAFVIPAGNMSDSAAPEQALSTAVDYDLTQSGSGWQLTVTPDMGWLNDTARVYPVRIDPSVLTKSIKRNCWLDQANPSTNGCGVNASYLRVGGGSGQLRRTIIDFDITAIPNTATIDSADLKLHLYAAQGTSNTTVNYGLHRPDRAWDNTATWNSSGASGGWVGGNPGAQATGTSLGIYGPTSGWRTFNAIGFVSNWRNGNWARNGILIRQESETSPGTNISFASGNHPTSTNRPELVVRYSENAAPSQPVITATPGGQGFVSSATPTITTTSTDPEGGRLTNSIWITQGATTIWSAPSAQVDSGSQRSVQVPAGTIEPGQTYEINSSVTDTFNSSESSIGVQVDSMAAAPSSTAPICADDCTPLPNLVAVNEAIAPQGVKTFSVGELLSDDVQDSLGLIRGRISVTTPATPGSMTVFSSDFSRPIAPTLTFNAGTTQSIDFTIWPSKQLTLDLFNSADTAISATVTLTGWTPWGSSTEFLDVDSDENAPLEAAAVPIVSKSVEEDVISLTSAQLLAAGEDPTITAPRGPLSVGGTACDVQAQTEQAGEGDIFTCLTELTENDYEARLTSGDGMNRAPGTSLAGGDAPSPVLSTTAERAERARGCRAYPRYIYTRFFGCTSDRLLYQAYELVGRVFILRGSAWFTVQQSILLSYKNSGISKIISWHLDQGYGWGRIMKFRSYPRCSGCSGGASPGVTVSVGNKSAIEVLDVSKSMAFGTADSVEGATTFSVTQGSVPIILSGGVKRARFEDPDLRCDRYRYFGGSAGCVFVKSTNIYILDRSRFPETADHVRFAQGYINNHWGWFGHGPALKREADKRAKYRNRRAAKAMCKARGYTREDGDCDEYSFASTVQGCFNYVCHVRPIDPTDNQTAGSDLGKYLLQQRIVDGDSYYVEVL